MTAMIVMQSRDHKKRETFKRWQQQKKETHRDSGSRRNGPSRRIIRGRRNILIHRLKSKKCAQHYKVIPHTNVNYANVLIEISERNIKN